MAIKKINKKGANTITGLVMSIILAMAIFFGLYAYWSSNVSSAGLDMESQYADVSANLTAAQDRLNNDVTEVQEAYKDITEAENTAFAVWNGMKGIGSTIKLFGNFVDTSLDTYYALIAPIGFSSTMATIFLGLAFIALVAFVVILVIRALKGEQAL